MSSSLTRLVRMLSAGFSNQAQAFENPPLYAHILVKFRPLPQLAPGSMLLEQSYAINPAAPYRIRVLRAERRDGGLIIHNQALHGDERFWGAVADAAKRDAIRRAAATRLRPVLMTSAATVFGHVMLIFVTGPGAAARNSIGWVLVIGMAVGTVFTLYVVPAFYMLIARDQTKLRQHSAASVTAASLTH